MLIFQLKTDPVFVVSVIASVVISICLHELAHGWAAIWQGDRTPIEKGHMTVNPLVHMGGFSLLLLVMVGIAYGAMPINPRRFRSRFGEALVSAAGPAMNGLLAVLGLTLLGLWMRAAPAETAMVVNARNALWYFGLVNLALMLFNLLPVPPLDGAHILSNLSPAYRAWIDQLSPGTTVLVLVAIFAGLSFADLGIFDMLANAGNWYLALLTG
jgi:Zn-dependent protease